MIDLDSKGKSSTAGRWRRMSAAAKQESESQGTFFSPPQANRESKVPARTAEEASSPAKVIESPIDPNLTTDQTEALRRIERPDELFGTENSEDACFAFCLKLLLYDSDKFLKSGDQTPMAKCKTNSAYP